MSYIRITLLSDLCAGSGESRGNAVDNDIAIDRNGFPVIPARRLKGVLSETAYWLLDKASRYDRLSDLSFVTLANVERLFGTRFGDQGAIVLRNAEIENAAEMKRWLAHELPDCLSEAATPTGISSLYAYVRGQTRMKDGIADNGSLRFTRVISRHNPFDNLKDMVFAAPVIIQDEDKALEDLLAACCNATRHIGTHRNRGLGQVRMEFVNEADTTATGAYPQGNGSDEMTRVTYRISIDSSLTIPGAEGMGSAIPSRSVIGCMASAWLGLPGHDASMEDFRDLFLNGTTAWSDLTPCAGGSPSFPVPLAVTKLKNRKGPAGETLYCNRFSAEGEKYGQEKQATLEGRFLGKAPDGKWEVLSVQHNMEYHHRHEHTGRADAPEEQLYMQESIEEGQLYAGSVVAPARLAGVITFLLENTDLIFGKSKSAQYGNCSLYGEPETEPETSGVIHTKPGDPVFAVLESDLVIAIDGILKADPATLRDLIGDRYPLRGTGNETDDYCLFRTRGGYHAMWHMQKPVVQTMAAGSCLRFESAGGDIPDRIRIGEFRQEGYGNIRFYTGEQMEGMTGIRDGTPDVYDAGSVSHETTEGLKHALAVQTIRTRMQKTANSWYNSVFRPNGVVDQKAITDYQPGKLRLMLEQSKDYEDFLSRINSISVSDSTESKAGHRYTYIQLTNSIYGKEKTQESMLRHLICEHESEDDPLLRMAMGSEELKKQVLSLWKVPVSTVLYRMHYEQKGDGR